MDRTVCIVGAGPAGLVAAKTLTNDHPKDTFHVTVLEKSHRIGGLWPVSKIDDGMVNPQMTTNLSRHTVSFSDLAWPDSSPQFPKAWQAGEYLQRYTETYPGYEIRLNCKVSKAELEGTKWKVRIEDMNSVPPAPQNLEFDHLIVASGFFGKERIPDGLESLEVPVFHSSRFRDVKDFLPTEKSPSNSARRIMVVGGQMSGVEVSASIASQLSSAAHSVEKSSIPHVSEYFVTNVIKRPFWVLPLLFPRNPVVEVESSDKKIRKRNNYSPTFLPLDLVTCGLSGRPAGPVQNTSGHITPERAGITHGFMKTFIGSDQSEFGVPELTMTGNLLSEPPALGFSNQYTEFLRSRKIQIVQGNSMKASGESSASICIQNGDHEHVLNDVAAVVFATGFDLAPSLGFLPQEILETLKFDPTADKFPLALNVHSSISRVIPSLGFVGFYRGPYWGVMQKQAQFLGKLWSGDVKAAQALAEDKTLENMMKLRNNPRAAQFPMGDYPYLMESFSEILGIKRIEPKDAAEGSRSGTVLPSRYLDDNASQTQLQQSKTALSVVEKIFDDSAETGRFVPWAIFRAMQGDWKLERDIKSRRSDYPSGKLFGSAYFHPRNPTDASFDLEYLYQENGEFVSEQGFNFTATRSYAYRYRESTDTLSAWFVKPKDNKTVDYLFHELEMIPPADSNLSGDDPWRAKSAHLCIADMYNVKYEFRFRGISLESWSQEYTVNGPAKDYTIKNVYRRPELRVVA